MSEPLSRIPLSKEEEHTVGSMARWMRFIAVVGICGALFMLLVIVIAAGVYSSVHEMTTLAPDSRWARAHVALMSAGSLPYLAAVVFLLAAAVALWQNMTLYHAGDDFHLVASTDTADLDYLARGLDRLRLFFKIQVLTVAVALSVALFLGVVAAAFYARGGPTP
jgi:hypothetical protein